MEDLPRLATVSQFVLSCPMSAKSKQLKLLCHIFSPDPCLPNSSSFVPLFSSKPTLNIKNTFQNQDFVKLHFCLVRPPSPGPNISQNTFLLVAFLHTPNVSFLFTLLATAPRFCNPAQSIAGQGPQHMWSIFHIGMIHVTLDIAI